MPTEVGFFQFFLTGPRPQSRICICIYMSVYVCLYIRGQRKVGYGSPLPYLSGPFFTTNTLLE